MFDREAAQLLIIDRIIERYPLLFGNHERRRVIEAFLASDRLSDLDYEAGMAPELLRRARTEHFLGLLGIAHDYPDELTGMYVREYPLMPAAMAGAAELIPHLAGRYRLGIVSNGFPDTQYLKLESIGIRRHCACVVLSEELGIRKPDPGIFLHAASLLGAEPAECLYVGNSYRDDVAGARSAGMTACWFNRRAAAYPDGCEMVPHVVISGLEELPHLLSNTI